jgi:putative SOS response-associated peptidase YedK
MCGRFTLQTPAYVVADLFGLGVIPDLAPRYNVAPTQLVPAVGVKRDGTTRGLVMMQWGLIPHWAHGERPRAFINAKSETAAELPSFHDPMRTRRCLVPADGFYEWAKEGSKKQPYHFRLAGGRPFAFAALWDRWHGPRGANDSCTILTTTANDLVRPLHDRMPCILTAEDFADWLDPQAVEPARVLPLLRPYPAEGMEAVAVNPYVNKAGNEGPECLEPAA